MLRGILRRVGSETGSVAIEFALTLPILLAITFGTVGFGLHMSARLTLEQIAGEAARASVAGLDDGERAELAEEAVADRLAAYGGVVNPALVVVDVGADPGDSDRFRVALTYDVGGLGIGAFSAFVPLPDLTITASAIVANGGT
ncbi:MAG: pilus assembly protein [Azospirillaceae bacterium]